MEPAVTALYERLAAIEHDRWAHWQRYLHSKCERRPDGSLVIPAAYVANLERLIDTPYGELTEVEKESDREQVARYWPLLSATPPDHNDDLAAALDNASGMLVTSSRDWGYAPGDAWVYGVLVGWECENGCQDPGDPEHSCDGAMRELAERHGWDGSDVARLRALRAAVARREAETFLYG
jgi:hypothetical protein